MVRSQVFNGILVTGICCGAFLFASSAFATTGCNAIGWDIRHSDVHGCDLYYPAIAWMYAEGIAEGEAYQPEEFGGDHVAPSTRFFHPSRPINRAEFTKLVLLGSGVRNPSPCTAQPFPDVPKDAWFAPYICAAKEKGIVSGFPDETFQPGRNITYANGSKILVHSFEVETLKDDLIAFDGEELWYKPYIKALLREKAVAPTIESFDHLITRGEMAEMIFRLANKKPSYVLPNEETDGEPLGMGYTYPFSLEFTLGLWVDPPDPPYYFTESTTSLWGHNEPLSGYKFFHTLQDLRCTESGLWKHCKPVFRDWSIGLYVTDSSLEEAEERLLLPEETKTLYFGGKPGQCSILGVEGEYIQYCFVPLSNKKTLVVEREFIDTAHVYGHLEGITPTETSDAWFARIRKSMQFAE